LVDWTRLLQLALATLCGAIAYTQHRPDKLVAIVALLTFTRRHL
jgi:hypothetical protein